MPRRVRLALGGRSHPERTCVGCRKRAAQSDLLRLVVQDAMVTPDPTGRLPGRGAYLHVDRRCWQAAQRRKAWSRALRVAGGLDTSRVAAYLADDPRV